VLVHVKDVINILHIPYICTQMQRRVTILQIRKKPGKWNGGKQEIATLFFLYCHTNKNKIHLWEREKHHNLSTSYKNIVNLQLTETPK